MFGVRALKKYGAAFLGGFVDRLSSRITGKKICIGKELLIKLGACEPWPDHIDSAVIPMLNEAIKNKDFDSARSLVRLSVMLSEKDGYKSFCVSLLLSAIDLLAQGEEVLIAATPFYYAD
jgi:hypothetical protein